MPLQQCWQLVSQDSEGLGCGQAQICSHLILNNNIQQMQYFSMTLFSGFCASFPPQPLGILNTALDNAKAILVQYLREPQPPGSGSIARGEGLPQGSTSGRTMPLPPPTPSSYTNQIGLIWPCKPNMTIIHYLQFCWHKECHVAPSLCILSKTMGRSKSQLGFGLWKPTPWHFCSLKLKSPPGSLSPSG